MTQTVATDDRGKKKKEDGSDSARNSLFFFVLSLAFVALACTIVDGGCTLFFFSLYIPFLCWRRCASQTASRSFTTRRLGRDQLDPWRGSNPPPLLYGSWTNRAQKIRLFLNSATNSNETPRTFCGPFVYGPQGSGGEFDRCHRSSWSVGRPTSVCLLFSLIRYRYNQPQKGKMRWPP